MLLLLVSCPDAKLMGLQPGRARPSSPIIFPPFLAHPHLHPPPPTHEALLFLPHPGHSLLHGGQST